MKKSNEEKLLRAIATKHIGDAEFCQKYGIKCESADKLLKPYYESNKDENPPEDLLEKANEIYIKEFSDELSKLFEKDILPESIYRDLIFKGTMA